MPLGGADCLSDDGGGENREACLSTSCSLTVLEHDVLPLSGVATCTSSDLLRVPPCGGGLCYSVGLITDEVDRSGGEISVSSVAGFGLRRYEPLNRFEAVASHDGLEPSGREAGFGPGRDHVRGEDSHGETDPPRFDCPCERDHDDATCGCGLGDSHDHERDGCALRSTVEISGDCSVRDREMTRHVSGERSLVVEQPSRDSDCGDPIVSSGFVVGPLTSGSPRRSRRGARGRHRGRFSERRRRAERRRRQTCLEDSVLATRPRGDAENLDLDAGVDDSSPLKFDAEKVLSWEALPQRLLRRGWRTNLLQPAMVVQRAWQKKRGMSSTKIQSEWNAKRKTGRWAGSTGIGRGSIDAHVRFLQWIFRVTRLSPRVKWAAGRLPAWSVALAVGVLRKRRRHSCQHGRNLAGDLEFESQRRLANKMLDWYSIYVAIYRRLCSGDVPCMVQGFCGAGGASEGAKRCGVDSVGIDLYDQADYKARFGDDHFVMGDATSRSLLVSVCKKRRPMGGMFSPPCQVYSRLRVKGEARHPALIEQTRDLASELFEWYSIENVMGAAKHLNSGAVELDGLLFGLRVFRSRLFETNFPVHVDECVRDSAAALRARCCLGGRRRWRLRDEFGRPTSPCCEGNMFAPLGRHPHNCTAGECSDAMGVDRGHMSFERLAQSIPPDYAQLIASQMCMRAAEQRFGVPVITFDTYRQHPTWARMTLARWLRGAGDDRVHAGMSLEVGGAECDAPVEETDVAPSAPSNVILSEVERREIYYSHAGGYDLSWIQSGGVSASQAFDFCRSMSNLPALEDLSGQNVYLEGEWDHLSFVLDIVSELKDGSRLTVVTESCAETALGQRGFIPLPCVVEYGGADSLIDRGLIAMCWGRRRSLVVGPHLDHAKVALSMDERDRLGVKTDPLVKSELAQSYLPWEPERWIGKGLDVETERMMTEGVRVEAEHAGRSYAVPQYSYLTAEATAKAIHEADRALAAGHMSYVPDEYIDQVLSEGIIHPWLVVQQGDKWRLCQDYSQGTNRIARTAPFGLPCVWDAVKVLRNGSFMAKYDLRDGFWGVPVHWDSRRYLVMRHPSTGRLMWCDRLPFGFLDSPRRFCHVSEAVAQLFRKRMAGKGVHIFCYCDDYIIIGDDEEKTREGCRAFEVLCDELGLQWAPHKQRGPCRCIEFLGLLIVNTPELQCVGLTDSRQRKLEEMIRTWLERQPGIGAPRAQAEPVDLARLLGHLVFASQCVPGGRTYMQGMLSQFKGLEVDWRHGFVRAKGADRWSHVTLSDGFWRDLIWWRDHLEQRNCVTVAESSRLADAAVVITGTDSSDWGSGQLVWLDGEREESRLKFGVVEKKRPINWRELLGILRVVKMAGARATGCIVLVETDNMTSKDVTDAMASKSEDMQELLRRLLDVVERFGMTLRVTHTPGEVLYRPDQTSRGDPIREPRVRVDRDSFEFISMKLGGFSEWLGGERRHRVTDIGSEPVNSIWMHPTFDSVGSALRCLGQRMSGSSTVKGAIMIPHDESAAWWRLTKHFLPIGRWEVGSHHLEMSQLGKWTSVSSQRATIVLSFPRAGARVRRVGWVGDEPPPAGYVELPRCGGWALPLLEGSYAYRPASTGGIGELYRVWRAFDPRDVSDELVSDDTAHVLCAELLEDAKRKNEFMLVPTRHRPNGEGGSFAPIEKLRPWEVPASGLWVVDHLVTTEAGQQRGRRSGHSAAVTAAAGLIYRFDRRAAEIEIAREIAASSDDVVISDDVEPGGSSSNEAFVQDVANLRLDDAHDSKAELQGALVAAATAALARVRASPSPRESIQRARELDVRSQSQFCRYSGQRCEGCGGELKFMSRIEVGVRAMVHSKCVQCKALAVSAATERAAERREAVSQSDKRPSSSKADGGVLPAAATTLTVRQSQFASKLSESRLASAAKCLAGCCKETNEPRMLCMRGCGRGVHLVSCLGTSAEYRAAGRLICTECRLSELLVDGDASTAPESLRRSCTISMVTEVTNGAVSTASGRSQFENLELLWMHDVGGRSVARLKMPRDNVEAFISFMWWLVRDAGRARSFATVMRAAGAVMTMTERVDFTKMPRVKAIHKEIQKVCAVEPHPCTPTTRVIIVRALDVTIPRLCTSRNPYIQAYLRARTKMLLVLELPCGARVGEAVGNGGEGHGLAAVDTCLQGESVGRLATSDKLGETFEICVRDSKTGPGRYAACVGKTKGPLALDVASIVRGYYDACGLVVTTSLDHGMIVERPDYYVVRVSGNGSILGKVAEEAPKSSCAAVRAYAPTIAMYANRRGSAKNKPEEGRFVNVVGGPKDCSEIAEAMSWLAGLGLKAECSIVPGPLLRATNGYVITHEPLAVESSYRHLVKAISEAHDEIKSAGIVDPEFDLQGQVEPKWGNHSLRRHADGVAQEALRLGLIPNVSKQLIDFFFGWLLKELSRDMQVHYAGLDRPARRLLAQVTMML